MISLREKATIMKATEVEKEQAEKREAKAERQRIAMAEIQQQLEEKKKAKEAVAETQRKEKEDALKKEEEYKKLEREMAEALKKKYLEILNENQQMIDTRSGNDIVKEKMDEVITELEKKKQIAEQEVQKTVDTEGELTQRSITIQDQVMKESNVVSTSLQNVEMKDEAVADLKQDEKAILKSSNNLNNRATAPRTSAQSTIDKSMDSGNSKTQSVQSKKEEKTNDPNEVIIEERESLE